MSLAALKKSGLMNFFSKKDSLDISIGNSNVIKLVALIFMIVDHIGAIFFPQIILFRIIGRLAFPLFLYQLSISAEKTKHPKRFVFYLLVFALFSEFPYLLLFGLKLNILFSFLLSVLFVFALKSKYYLALPFIFFAAIFTDAGWYGLVLLLAFVFVRQEIFKLLLFMLITIVSVYLSKNPIQFYSLAFIPLLFAITGFNLRLNINRHMFYFGYLGHLLLLLAIKVLIQ